KTKNNFKYKKLDFERVVAECKNKDSQGCNWEVTARKIPEEATFSIRKVGKEHSCVGPGDHTNPACNARFVSEYLKKKLTATSTIPKAWEIVDDWIWPAFDTYVPYWVANDAR
ncbi:hypothetical protein MKW92_042503, partial [Papaver armeniacum]